MRAKNMKSMYRETQRAPPRQTVPQDTTGFIHQLAAEDVLPQTQGRGAGWVTALVLVEEINSHMFNTRTTVDASDIIQ